MPARPKITMRIRLLLALAALGLLALSGIGLWSLHSQMLDDRRVHLRNIVDLTLSLARAAMLKAGGPESEAGRKAFFEAVQTARFGKEKEQNYVFAYDYDGVAKSHIDPNRLGQNRINVVYPNGVKLIQEFVRIAKSTEGTGFIEYPVEKGAGGPFTPKLSVIQNVPEIGGLVGVGAYIDDVDADTYRQLFIEGAMLAAVLATIGAAGFLVARTLMAATSELERQLAGAIALQSDMLPSPERVAQIQSRCPLDLSSYYGPRDGVGGDLWGTEVIGPQRIMIYVADFTGHGVSAALNTARFHSFVHMELQSTSRPATLLRRLNDRLHAVLPAGQFATMFCVAIDFRMQTIDYASAGAPPQLYRGSREAPFEVISQPGMPLGIFPGVAYESRTAAFHPGGTLVLYTDGLVETPKPPRSLYTTESLRDILNTASEATSLQLSHRLLHEFSKAALKADDDITLIIARNTGAVTEPLNDGDADGAMMTVFVPRDVYNGREDCQQKPLTPALAGAEEAQ